ncbi:hypothetical protein [Rhizobium sp. 16-449-1b]|uniref:hypothetical protein n=1 Tax=Rhizobium sp. 16-449-1b TaxID=2819989 RepID=UPI001ADC81F4|nr:hypothetical protein [Rhizobium sp. 16-449-1b]
MNAPGPAVSRGFFDATVDSVGFAKEIRSRRVWIFYYLLPKMEVEVAIGWIVTRRALVQATTLGTVAAGDLTPENLRK